MFKDKNVEISKLAEARKEKIENEEAWNLLQQCSEIIVGRGTKTQIFDPQKDDKDKILTACLGRTGNLRAPALKTGTRLIIGFNEEMYKQYIS